MEYDLLQCCRQFNLLNQLDSPVKRLAFFFPDATVASIKYN